MNGPAAMNQFRRTVDGDFQQVSTGVDINLAGGTGSTTRVLNFPQDRILLQLSPGRSIIVREYPQPTILETDLGRLAYIATAAIDCTPDSAKAGPLSYGYNMQIVFNQTECELGMEYLARKMLNHQAVSFWWPTTGRRDGYRYPDRRFHSLDFPGRAMGLMVITAPPEWRCRLTGTRRIQQFCLTAITLRRR